MAKHTCDSLLDLTSNAKMVTGSPVPYNRFMKCIHQKQFWKQVLALWKKNIEYSIFQIHEMLLYKEIKFIHVVDLRSGCKKRDECKIQPYHQVFIKKIIINHLRNRPSQTIRQTVFFKYLCSLYAFKSLKRWKKSILVLQFVNFLQ